MRYRERESKRKAIVIDLLELEIKKIKLFDYFKKNLRYFVIAGKIHSRIKVCIQ